MDARGWPLVGRGDACAALASALGSEPPRSVVIAGAAGVGRTRLLREAQRMEEEREHTVLRAAGSNATGVVPLGALAHILPARTEGGTDSLALLQRAAQAIAGDPSGPPPVLCVDDVHLLDPLSVTLLHQLATAGAVTLILSVRTAYSLPDPTASLWKDGLVTRLDVHPLRRGDVEWLLTDVLDGHVESRTVERLWRLTLGNPLFLREFVDDGLRTDRLNPDGGLWRWHGDMSPSDRLAAIVLGQIAPMGADEWRVLEILAAAEPMPMRRLLDCGNSEAVIAMQRRGIVVDDDAAGPASVRSAHPLYTEVVRCRTPEAALRLIRCDLAQDDGGPPGDDVVRRSLALLDGDRPVTDHGLLTDAARRALAMADIRAAHRLGRAAVQAGGGAAALHVHSEAARWSGESVDSEHAAPTAAAASDADVDTARLAAHRALTRVLGVGDRGGALDILRVARDRSASEEARMLVATGEAVIAFVGGEVDRAVALASSVLSSPTRGGAAEPLASAVTAVGQALAGRTRDALALVEAGRTAARSAPHGPEFLLARLLLAHAEVAALYMSGRMEDLERRTAELHAETLAGPTWPGDAVACLHRGWAALGAGRPREAHRWLLEARSDLERSDPTGVTPLCAALLAMSQVLLGEVAEAAETLAEQARRTSAVRVFDPLVGVARAWVMGAEGQPARALQHVLAAASEAAEQGQAAQEALILHSAVRWGGAAQVVDRLAELAGTTDSPLVADLAAHAAASASGGGDRLTAISTRFERTGSLLFAADASADAASVYERAGAPRAAAAAATKAATLARDCGLIETPTLVRMLPPSLTPREYEVARFAARGMSNHAIAARLVVSVRTVETHLSHVYTKLGIASRAELTAALKDGESRPAPPHQHGHRLRALKHRRSTPAG